MRDRIMSDMRQSGMREETQGWWLRETPGFDLLNFELLY